MQRLDLRTIPHAGTQAKRSVSCKTAAMQIIFIEIDIIRGRALLSKDLADNEIKVRATNLVTENK